MAEIVIKQVAKRFGGFTALHSIDLTIADQEFMVLLGASGCGKTTLLRIVAGLETQARARSGSAAVASTICRRANAASLWCSRITPCFRT